MSSFVYPSNAILNRSDVVLTDNQVNQWKNNGFVLVNYVIDTNTTQSSVQAAADILKNWHVDDFGSEGLLEFPTTSSLVNKLTLHPRLLTAVSQLLNTTKYRLLQADLWKKEGQEPKDEYPPLSNIDQRIHMDFPNHTLVHPPQWSDPQAVEIIIYLSDCNECGGSTALVPKQGDADPAYQYPYVQMPGFGTLQWRNNRKCAEDYVKKESVQMYEFRKMLYDREKYAYFVPGTVLFYRYDLWHRGTPLKNGKIRYVQNMAFAKDGTDWVGCWNSSVAREMYQPKQVVEKMIAELSPFQRSVLFGFPRVGSDYWNTYTLDAVKQRYECFGFDITPYRNGINKKHITSKL